MSVSITNVRKWLNVAGGVKLQSAYQSPVNDFTAFGLWFESISFNENPVKSEFQGLNANNFESTSGRAIKRYEPWLRVRGRVTPSVLLQILPAASGGLFSGANLVFAVTTLYLSIAFRDNASAGVGQAWRFADCQVSRLLLHSEVAGELMFELDVLPEQFIRESLGATVIVVPDKPSDFERFNHRSGQPLLRDPGGIDMKLATGLFRMEIVQKLKPHFGPALLPVNLKAGYTVLRGEVRGRYSDEYKDVREDALSVTYRRMVQTWLTAGGTKGLTLDLKNVDLEPWTFDAGGRRIDAHRASWETFSDGIADPVLVSKAGF